MRGCGGRVMGDMADWSIEQGSQGLASHLFGDCEGYCPYCWEEEKRRKSREKRKVRKAKESGDAVP